MKQPFDILIADRNPHVRELLKRELSGKGYRIQTVHNGLDAIKWIYDYSNLDLIIIDPEMPDIDKNILLRKLKNRVPSISIILHVFPSDDCKYADMLPYAVIIEKKENSIEEIRNLVSIIQEK